MLTILNDPAGATGRARHPWDFTLTMQENVERHMTHGGDCMVLLNGIEIDPATNPRMDDVPSELDELTVVHRPEGIETWLLVASLALSVAAIAMIPKPQVQEVGKESPNNRLTQQTNVARAYQAIPDVYGAPRVWPDLIQPSTVEYIGHVKYVTEWLCVSRGKGDLTDFRYAETPITDIDGASLTIFEPASSPSPYPELNSTTLTDVLETFEVPDVNGQEIRLTPGALPVVTFRAAVYSGLSSNVFTLTFTDSSDFDVLKSIAGVGTALIETYGGVYPEDPEAGFPDFYRTVSVTSYTASGGSVTFTFTSPDPIWPGVTASGLWWQVSPLSGTPSTTVGPFTLPVASDGLRWNIIFLRGLKGACGIDVTYWQIDGGGAVIPGTSVTVSRVYEDDTFDQRYFTTTVFPTSGFGTYRVQFVRTNLENSDGTDVAKLEEVYAVRRYATKVLPGVTIAKVVTKATEQATGFSERKFNAQWQRHIRTLTSDSISASRNFARTMAHVWTLAGEDIAELDTTALQAVNTALGETSPLLRFDGTFDDADMSLGERLQRIAYHARCVVWRDGTKWTVTRDEARSVPQMQLDYRTLAKGGQSGITYAAHLPASYDGVEVEYVDETTGKKKAYVNLTIVGGTVASGIGANPLKIKMPACRTLAQATNRAQLEARRLLYQRTNVSDTALSDAGSLGVGSLVRWIDPHDFAGDDGLQAGEVLSIAGTTIETSEAIDFKGETEGRVIFTGIDGLVVGAPVICTPGTDSRHLVLASLPSGVYIRNGTTRQLGSRYAFAVGFTDAELEAAGLYVVTALSPAGARNIGVALANYDARMYAADANVSGLANGRTLTATASLIGGSATGAASQTATGATLTASASLLAGGATGNSSSFAAGRTFTATASLIAGSATGSVEPYFSSVALLLHGNGTDGSTTIVDSGPGARTVSVFGNAQIDTAQSKYGGASILFDGSGDYLQVADATEFDFGSGDFTIEFWVRFSSLSTTQSIIGKRLASDYGPFSLIYSAANARFEARFDSNTSNFAWDLTVAGSGGGIAVDTWYHYAVTRSGSDFRSFVNGALQVGTTLSGSLAFNSQPVSIGANSDGGLPMSGWLDDLRITKGVARYTASFTPPTAQLPS